MAFGNFMVGDVVGGRFEVLRIHDEGSMGLVFKCLDKHNGNIYGLKTIKPEWARGRDAHRDLRRFKKEALAWVLLKNYPNIVRAFTYKEFDGRPFVIMEYVSPDVENRNNLSHYLKYKVSTVQAMDWALQFCDGMEYAFSRGLKSHRDIKPDNIMISSDGKLKVTDFGLVKLWQTGDSPETWINEEFSFSLLHSSKPPMGSLPWRPPEFFTGEMDRRGDIYAFGVILFQLLNQGNWPIMPNLAGADNQLAIIRFKEAHQNNPVP